MAYQIISPAQSFVQFNEGDLYTSCELAPVHLCLPVYDEGDVWFQFVLRADSDAEADALCDLDNALVRLGIVRDCGDGLLIEFAEKPERYRIGALDVLFNWQHGMPDFATEINGGECFKIKVLVGDDYAFCSNCFQRILDDCHTSVVEYGNDDNFAGFNYCNGEPISTSEGACDPTFIEFGPEETKTIAYTASLLAKYGNFPTIEVWGYIGSDLVRMTQGIEIKADGYPPSTINFDFGGELSGIIKIRK
jgi:hypothetical protein